MSVKYSIIVPVYNVRPYLSECLEAVLLQSVHDWECICVDDGSLDGSGDLLDEYGTRDSRIRVIHTQNRGVSAARNAAIDIARGEWITFLDADDVYTPIALQIFERCCEMGDEADMLQFSIVKDAAVVRNCCLDTPYVIRDKAKIMAKQGTAKVKKYIKGIIQPSPYQASHQ